MNSLHLGLSKSIEAMIPVRRGYLFIHDEVPDDIPHAVIFDPRHHCLNPLTNIDYKAARQLADTLYTISPQGENTLTVRNGKRALLKAFLDNRHLDKISVNEEVDGMIADLLMSPVLRRVLCTTTNFSFNSQTNVLARINRQELGDFDAFVLGQVLIARFQGQLIIPDFGFYGRDAHTHLIRNNRLIAGLNFLDEVPLRLRNTLLLIKDKHAARATYDDALLIAKLEARYTPGQHGFSDRIAEVTA